MEKTGKRVRRWKGHYRTYHLQPDGREKSKHRSVTLGLVAHMTKAQAQAKHDAIIQGQTGQTPLPDASLTLEQFITEVYLPGRQAHWERNTISANTTCLERYIKPQLGALKLDSINKARLDEHLGALAKAGKGRSTLNRARALLHAIFEEAVDSDYLDRNRCRKVKVPPVARPKRRLHLLADEVQLIFSKTHGEPRLVLHILLLCGLRPGELLALRWNDVLEHEIRVDESAQFGETKPTKSGRVRFVPLPASLRQDLLAYRDTAVFCRDEDFIFPTRKGAPQIRQSAEKRYVRHARSATGIQDLTFQTCRRTFSTLIKGYAETRGIQAILGHAKPSTTLEHYIQPTTETQRQAVEQLAHLLGRVQ